MLELLTIIWSCYKVKLELEILLRKLTMNFMMTKYIRSTSLLNLYPDKAIEYLPAENVYMRITAHESLQALQSNPTTKADKREVKAIYECYCKLYVDAMKQIKQRFSVEDELLTLCEILDPTTALDISAIDLVQNILPEI